MKKELAALEEEKKAIAESLPTATWSEQIRVRAVGDPTANKALKLLRLEEAWSRTRFTSKLSKTCWPTLTKKSETH